LPLFVQRIFRVSLYFFPYFFHLSLPLLFPRSYRAYSCNWLKLRFSYNRQWKPAVEKEKS
jgi:hypothetical protein